MTIYDEYAKLCAKTPGASIEKDFVEYVKMGAYIFQTPHYLLIGSRIGDAWFIHVAIGDIGIKRFINLMPYYLPIVGWCRYQRGRKDIVWIQTYKLFKKYEITGIA
jgi:hypothetical protein